MNTTLDDIARELAVTPLQAEEMRLLLDATRDVAHSSERRYAPLAAFLLGAAVGSTADRSTALPDAISRVLAVLEQPGPPAG